MQYQDSTNIKGKTDGRNKVPVIRSQFTGRFIEVFQSPALSSHFPALFHLIRQTPTSRGASCCWSWNIFRAFSLIPRASLPSSFLFFFYHTLCWVAVVRRRHTLFYHTQNVYICVWMCIRRDDTWRPKDRKRWNTEGKRKSMSRWWQRRMEKKDVEDDEKEMEA